MEDLPSFCLDLSRFDAAPLLAFPLAMPRGQFLPFFARFMVSAALFSTLIAPKLSRSFMFLLFWNVVMS